MSTLTILRHGTRSAIFSSQNNKHGVGSIVSASSMPVPGL